jgi:hypothetical protein
MKKIRLFLTPQNLKEKKKGTFNVGRAFPLHETSIPKTICHHFQP